MANSNDARPAPVAAVHTPTAAMQKARLAEDAWNTRDPAKVALAYAIESRWRNRSEFIKGRNEIILFSLASGRRAGLQAYQGMWAFTENRIAVCFAYEWQDDSDRWYRSTAMRTGNSVMMAS